MGGAPALVVSPDSVTNAGRDTIAAFALKHGLPSVSGLDSYAEAGLPLMYGPSLSACWSRLAYHVDRILKGVAPADLPVEMTMTFETIINLKTTRSLGTRVPQSLLLRADRVIE
jgi:putative ABC transport system substrate-binding protein